MGQHLRLIGLFIEKRWKFHVQGDKSFLWIYRPSYGSVSGVIIINIRFLSPWMIQNMAKELLFPTMIYTNCIKSLSKFKMVEYLPWIYLGHSFVYWCCLHLLVFFSVSPENKIHLQLRIKPKSMIYLLIKYHRDP